MRYVDRRAGEALVIDGRVRVRVTEIQGNEVRLEVRAPSDVMVLRGEIYEQVFGETEAGEAAAK